MLQQRALDEVRNFSRAVQSSRGRKGARKARTAARSSCFFGIACAPPGITWTSARSKRAARLSDCATGMCLRSGLKKYILVIGSKLSETRTRLYRRRLLQPNTHFLHFSRTMRFTYLCTVRISNFQHKIVNKFRRMKNRNFAIVYESYQRFYSLVMKFCQNFTKFC